VFVCVKVLLCVKDVSRIRFVCACVCENVVCDRSVCDRVVRTCVWPCCVCNNALWRKRPSTPPEAARRCKCHACHTRATPMTPSATPATPKTVATQGLVCDKIVCVCDKVVRGRVVCVCVWQNCVCVCCVCVCDKVAVWKSCVWRSVGDKVVVWKSCVWQSCGWQSCVLQSFVWQKLWVTPSCYGTRWNCALCEPMSCVFYLKLRPLENLGLIFTGVFYRVFAWTRKRGHNVFLPW